MKAIDTNTFEIVPSKKIQVLIVEDEYIIAANLQENLESLGYGVLDIVSSAVEAIEAAIELHPDLVLMDVQLQGEMDGIQAAEQIWNHLKIPIIYVTGHSDQSTVERAKITFPFGYILKPVKGKELYVAIETALNRYEREQLLDNVLKNIGDGMIVVNTHGHILFLNRSAELLTGWQQHEARDRELTEVFNIISEASRLPIANVAIAAMQQDITVFLSERILLITKDGTTLPITDSVAPIKDHKDSITGAVLIFRDDTQRQLQEEHNQALQRTQVLQRQREELERLNQLKDDFLSTVSHELRTPLANIKMAVQMLEVTLVQQRKGNSETNAIISQMSKYISIVRDQCNQELNLVNDLLELQQIEANTYPLKQTAIELEAWIFHVLETFQERAQCQQQLYINLSPDLPVLVANLTILTRIFTELLTNAFKYTPPGKEITIAAHAQSENRIQLIVSNTGVEIPVDELMRIFEKFYRIPTGDRYQYGGTGLGLALVKKLVTYLGGSIWAESGAGQTRFVVELPIQPPDTDPQK
jgi:PAS domain S-box-containing protein